MRMSLQGFWGNGVALDFVNGDFVDITGWTVLAQQIKLNGRTNIGGWDTPLDTKLPPHPVGDNTTLSGQTFGSEFVTSNLPPGFSSPSRALRLYNDGVVNVAYGIAHGPAVISDQSVRIIAGSTVEFWWRAYGSTDAYDIYGYLLNIDTGSTIELINETGPNDTGLTSWALSSKIIPAGISGDYKFVFVSGSYDFTGGQAYGASLLITGVRVSS